VSKSSNGDSEDERLKTAEVCIGDTRMFFGFRTSLYAKSDAKYIPRLVKRS